MQTNDKVSFIINYPYTEITQFTPVKRSGDLKSHNLGNRQTSDHHTLNRALQMFESLKLHQ